MSNIIFGLSFIIAFIYSFISAIIIDGIGHFLTFQLKKSLLVYVTRFCNFILSVYSRENSTAFVNL